MSFNFHIFHIIHIIIKYVSYYNMKKNTTKLIFLVFLFLVILLLSFLYKTYGGKENFKSVSPATTMRPVVQSRPVVTRRPVVQSRPVVTTRPVSPAITVPVTPKPDRRRVVTNIVVQTEKPAIVAKTCDQLSSCPTVSPPLLNTVFDKTDLTGYWYLQINDWYVNDFKQPNLPAVNINYSGNVYLMPDERGNAGGYSTEQFYKKFWSILPLDSNNQLPSNPYGTGKWGIKLHSNVPDYYAISIGNYPGDNGTMTMISPTQLKVDENTFMKRLYRDADGKLKMYAS